MPYNQPCIYQLAGRYGGIVLMSELTQWREIALVIYQFLPDT